MILHWPGIRNFAGGSDRQGEIQRGALIDFQDDSGLMKGFECVAFDSEISSPEWQRRDAVQPLLVGWGAAGGAALMILDLHRCVRDGRPDG